MHGLLVIDKPVGPTSHDVVARVRRALRERRIGHTGTLDPFASGVLPLVIGKATRLARFFSGAAKEYHATVRLGVATDTHDHTGRRTGGARHDDPLAPLPGAAHVEAALGRFRGTFLQLPPRFSAKKVAGVRSYEAARRDRDRTAADSSEPAEDAPALTPVRVTVSELRLTACADDVVELAMRVSAGFYVRALAHELGVALGCGAHLLALRRTRSGELGLSQSVPLADVEGDPEAARAHLVPLDAMLPDLPAVELTIAGRDRVAHGGPVDASACAHDRRAGAPPGLPVRLLGPGGELLAIAEPHVSDPPWPLRPVTVLT